MIEVSQEFLDALAERTDFYRRGVIHLPDGTDLPIGSDPENDITDFTYSGSSYTDSADSSIFPLGTAICRTIEIELLNDEKQLQPADGSYDFFNAEVELYLDFELDDGTTETITIGKYTVVTPATWGTTVVLTAADDMWKTDKPYHSSRPYPTTLGEVFHEACDNCGLLHGEINFRNSDFIVTQPLSSDYTFRQAFGYIAMIAGGNARISREFSNVEGTLWSRMEILMYDLSYGEEGQTLQDLSDWISIDYDLNDVAITGLSVTATEGNKILSGMDGYVLDLTNPFFIGYSDSDISDFLAADAQYFVGKTFRKFQGDTFGYPIAEFMDPIHVFDGEIEFFTVITDINFFFGGKTTLKTSAESNVAQASVYASEAQKAIIKTKELFNLEREEREVAIAGILAAFNSLRGMYSTEVTGIWYLHDKPELSDSTNIIKVTADSIAFSTTGNGEDSYAYGFTLNGEALLNLIVTNGLLTNWLKTARISSEDDSTVLDLANNQFSLGGGKISYTVNDQGVGTLTINADNVQFKGADVATAADVEAAAAAAQASINSINGTVAGMKKTTDDLENYIKINPNDPSVKVGSNVGNVKVSDQSVEISGSDGAKTTIGSSRMTTNQLTVMNDAIFGNFAFVTLEDGGDLVLKYVGGAE